MVRDGFCLYSMPPAFGLLDRWHDYIDGYRIGDLYHNEVFQMAFRKRTL